MSGCYILIVIILSLLVKNHQNTIERNSLAILDLQQGVVVVVLCPVSCQYPLPRYSDNCMHMSR